MLTQTQSIPACGFFVTNDPPPGNVWMMCYPPQQILIVGEGRERHGLCQNLDDESYWSIAPDLYVRLLSRTEYDQKRFHFDRGRDR